MPSLLQLYPLMKRSVYYFQPIIQHSLLSFPLWGNPYKVIHVGKNTTGVHAALVAGAWSDDTEFQTKAVSSCPESLLKAAGDEDTSYCHSQAPKEWNFLFEKGSSRAVKAGLVHIIRESCPGKEMKIETVNRADSAVKGQNRGTCS